FKRGLLVCFSGLSTGHFSRPVKQTVRVKRVHHPHIFMIVEREIKVSARATQPVAITFALCGSSAIFLRHMLVYILSLWRHAWVQLERVPGEGELCLALKPLHGLFQLFITDNAPRADHVRDNIYGNDRGLWHGSIPYICVLASAGAGSRFF